MNPKHASETCPFIQIGINYTPILFLSNSSIILKPVMQFDKLTAYNILSLQFCLRVSEMKDSF